MDYGNRLAPVALAVERPVLHFVLNAAAAHAELFKLVCHAADRVLFVSVSVEKIGIHHFAVARICLCRNIAAADDFDNIRAELFRKVIVALIGRGHRQYSARAVAHHNIVGNEYGKFLAVYGIYRGKALKLYARFILYKLCALELRFLCALFTVCQNIGKILYPVRVLVKQRMLGRHYHERYAEKRVGTGSIYLYLIVRAGNAEVYKRAR